MKLLNEMIQQNVEINDCGNDYVNNCISDCSNYESITQDVEISGFYQDFSDYLCDGLNFGNSIFLASEHSDNIASYESVDNSYNSDGFNESDNSNSADNSSDLNDSVTSLGCTSRRVFNRDRSFEDVSLDGESSDKNSSTSLNKPIKVNVKLFNSSSNPHSVSNEISNPALNFSTNTEKKSAPSNISNTVSNIRLNMTSTSTTSSASSSVVKPGWIKVKAPVSKTYHETRELVRNLNINTVCEEAACPNIGECWSKKHAAFMILGDVCTRACAFCNVKKGRPCEVDKNEPKNVGMAVKQMGLRHVVITSVDRDDLADGGAFHFVDVIYAIREFSPETTIEVLTPDFLRKDRSYEKIVKARPDVYNHNVETVPRLHPSIRRGARYFNSIRLLYMVKEMDDTIFTKSGMMVGLGETNEEIYQVMDDLRDGGVNFFTIGQYLRPTPKHAEVKRYVTPEEFQEYERIALKKGFDMVSASALTRSSYHADSDFEKLRSRMNAKK